MSSPAALHFIAQHTDFAPERILAYSVEEILPQLSQKLRDWHRTAEMVRYALHFIATHADPHTGLAVVHARTFCRVAGRRHGHAILNELRALGYLSCDGKYWAEKFAKRYGLTAKAEALPLALIDAGPVLSQSIRELRERKNAETLADVSGARSLFNDLFRFTLPVEAEAEQVLRERRAENPTAELHYRLAIDQLSRRHFYIRSCSTGRVFHNLSGLPRKLRPFLRVDGLPSAEVDIAACQPTLMLSLYPAPGPERCRYAEVIQTGFYEYLARQIEVSTGKCLSRETIKERWLQQVFGLDKHRKEIWGILNRDFPLLCQAMDTVRAHDYREIAHRLQRLEADLVIGRIVPQIKARFGNVGLSTVHDSLICPRAIAQEVAAITREVLSSALTVEPLVRIK